VVEWFKIHQDQPKTIVQNFALLQKQFGKINILLKDFFLKIVKK
jgi:hypothetical protein